MLTDELRGHIADAIALDGASASRTINLIKCRVNGATSEQLLAVAVAMSREQQEHIVELEYEVEELTNAGDNLENELADLEAELEALRAKPAETMVST